MASVGDKICSNEISRFIFYDANGSKVELAENCLLLLYEVVSVDAQGKPNLVVKLGGSGGGTVTPPVTPTVPADAWVDENNDPILDELNDYILI